MGYCRSLVILNWVDLNFPCWFPHAFIDFACVSVFVRVEPGFLYGLTHSLCCVCAAPAWGLALTLSFLQGHPRSLLNPMYASSPHQHLSLTQMSVSSRNTFQGNSCLLGLIEILQHSGVWSLASWCISRTYICQLSSPAVWLLKMWEDFLVLREDGQ